MVDVFKFMVECVFGFFATLDNITFFGNISLLKLLIIFALFTTIISFLFNKKGGN